MNHSIITFVSDSTQHDFEIYLKLYTLTVDDDISLNGYVTMCISIHLVMVIWIASSFGLYIKLLQPFMYNNLHRYLLHLSCINTIGIQVQGHVVILCLILLKLPIGCPKWLCNFTFPLANYESSGCITPQHLMLSSSILAVLDCV